MVNKNVFTVAISIAFAALAHSQQSATVIIDAAEQKAKVSPTLHGIFFEEISHAGEGGLYAELIQNRGFEERRLPPGTVLKDGFIVPSRTPHFMMPNNGVSDWKLEWSLKSEWPAWSLSTTGNSKASLSLTQNKPLNNATPNSLQIDIISKTANEKVNLINEGYWGINTIAGNVYNCSFYIRTNEKYKGAVTASLQADDGTALAAYTFTNTNNKNWKKYSCTLKAIKNNPKAKFVLSFEQTGTVWIDFVSLFPAKTFMNRSNGLRKDLAQYIAGLKPAFIRWPGGCFVEGINIENAHNWKNTIGPIEKRPGTYSPWGYWSSDGFGYHEYLQFCEDINATALYVFNVGISCEYRSGTYVPEDSMGSYLQNALDAIEYAIGPVTSKWGKLRAANGHPKPFPLKYVEVGNEQHGPDYAKRYNVFYNAIKTKYPGITIMASMGIGDVNKNTLDSMTKVDMVDEHAYKSVYWSMMNNDHFDKYQRGKWDMYVGEYATNNGVGAGNMNAALSDAVYIMAMERNGDLVKMSSYAPLLVNVNDVDWPVNLINFDASKSFGRISYYVIKMMNENRADVNLATQTTVTRKKTTIPQFSGGIGLATWDTKTAYKDIEIKQNGRIVYKSDFLNNKQEWDLLRGVWKWQDSALAQTEDGQQKLAILKNKQFDTYTLTLKAKKLDSYNAFIIPFALKDSNTFLRAHIGAWWNSHAVFEKVTNGYDVANITQPVKLKQPVETNKWYDIRLEVGMDTVKCFLNDDLVMTYTEPNKIFALAGRDEKNGDIIIKIVNATAGFSDIDFTISGLKHTVSSATLAMLSSIDGNDENSFTMPKQFIPVSKIINLPGNSFHYKFNPFSISVLRIKDGGWGNKKN